MKNRLSTAVILLVALITPRLPAQEAQLAASRPPRRAIAVQDGISVFFSPGGGCTQAIVAEIGQARKTVQVQAYSFTSAPIAKALLDAHKRGVAVTAVLDKSQRTEKYSSATFLHNQGVPVFIDAKHAIAHNKIILIDGRTIITGSFNFSKAAEESNAENLLILRDKNELVAAYERNFQIHLQHAEKYEGKVGEAEPPARGPPDSQARSDPARPVDANVFITRTGTKYHAAGCSSLAGSSTVMPLTAAKAKGCTACARCKPPQ